MRRRHTFRQFMVAAGLMCAALPFAAVAQEQAQSTSTEIPARLRHLEGTVTVQRAAAGETEGAVINLPLGSGDRIWTDDDGRVEISFEDGTSLWLDARSTLDFVSLPRADGEQATLVRLWSGSAFVHRPAPYDAALVPFRVDAPTGSAIFEQEGLFRIDVDDDQTVWLSAYDGSAVLDAGGLSERVTAGQRTLAESDSAPARAAAFNTSESDDFSIWRDQRMAQYASTQEYTRQREYLPANVSRYAAELEPYGTWSYHPTYASWYWKPYAAVAWTPYRHGRWVYTYAGWSWVPDVSWGYVTTHYGRWHYGSSGWIWFPGPVWRPASVHWYVGGGYVGWVPLNYYGRPAVSFGVHVGGGFGVSVNVNIGGGYYYPYYGYGHSYWGYRPYYRCCNYYGGTKWKWQHGRYPHATLYAANRGGRDGISPIGSRSGRGRVINGRGYYSGLGDAWTMVPANDFSTASVGRRAVRRDALPGGLDQAANAELTGNLRARTPGSMVPDSTRRAVPRGAQADPASVNGAGAVRATTRGAAGGANARPRVATPRQGNTSPAVANDPARRANGPAATSGRAVRRNGAGPAATTPQRPTSGPRAVRRTGNQPAATTPQRATTAPRAVRRAGNQPAATTPQRATTAPRAVRRSGGRPTATTPQRPTTARPSVAAPRAPQPRTGGAARSRTAPRPGRPGGSPASSAVRSPAASPRTAPSPGSTVRSRSARPTTRRAPNVGSPQAAPRSVRPASPSRTMAPRGGASRPTVTRRSASPPAGGARPAPTVRSSRPSSASAPRGNVRRAVPSGRTAPAVRPAPSARRAPSVRPAPSAPSRGAVSRPPAAGRGGSGAARPRRAAKPRGGSGGL